MKRKKSKGIAFFISLFFILLNMISFFAVFFLISNQYSKMARRNIQESNRITAASMERLMDDVRFYMNDLTLKMYADSELNTLCSRLYREEYEDSTEREILVTEAEKQAGKYLYDYTFVQSIGIFIEDSRETDIRVRRSSLNHMQEDYRGEIQDEVIENAGVIECFDVGEEHQLVFARTIRDYENVLKDDRIIGTVMLIVSEQYLTDSLKNTLVTPNSFAVLADDDGVVTHSTQEELLGKTLTAGYENAQDSKNEIYSAFLENLGQSLVIVTPWDDISLSIGDFTKTLTIAVLFTIFLNLAVVLLVSNILTRPMERLVEQIRNVGIKSTKGQYIQARGYSEIENIAENFNAMMKRLENLVKENYEMGISEKNARIEALQSQINPHFIFNTLDTINWKVMFLDVPEVTNMISCLGDMLRYTTYKYGEYVTVEQEVMQIQNYLYIQKIRYDNSFQEYIKIDEEAKKIIIPCLIIQPLVENAVVHGLRGKKKGVLVLSVRMREEYLEIMVFDNGQGMDEETIQELLAEKEGKNRESIGVANVRQRLQLTYSLEQGLAIRSRPGFYTRIEMRIPVDQESERK